MQRALQERELAQELSAQEEQQPAELKQQPAELEMRVPGQERCREARVWPGPGGQGQALRRKARVRPVV